MLLCAACAASQPAPSAAKVNPANYSVQGTVQAAPAPVSYASLTELNNLLAQLEQTSKAAQTDLTALRIEKWKTDSGTKKQALAGADSVQRNLKGALPEIVGQLRAAPEDLPATWWKAPERLDRKMSFRRCRLTSIISKPAGGRLPAGLRTWLRRRKARLPGCART